MPPRQCPPITMPPWQCPPFRAPTPHYAHQSQCHLTMPPFRAPTPQLPTPHIAHPFQCPPVAIPTANNAQIPQCPPPHELRVSSFSFFVSFAFLWTIVICFYSPRSFNAIFVHLANCTMYSTKIICVLLSAWVLYICLLSLYIKPSSHTLSISSPPLFHLYITVQNLLEVVWVFLPPLPHDQSREWVWEMGPHLSRHLLLIPLCCCPITYLFLLFVPCVASASATLKDFFLLSFWFFFNSSGS